MNCVVEDRTLIGKKSKAESSSGAVTEETVDSKEEGNTDDDPCFSIRGRRFSTTSSSFSMRSGSSTSLILSLANEKRGWPLT